MSDARFPSSRVEAFLLSNDGYVTFDIPRASMVYNQLFMWALTLETDTIEFHDALIKATPLFQFGRAIRSRVLFVAQRESLNGSAWARLYTDCIPNEIKGNRSSTVILSAARCICGGDLKDLLLAGMGINFNNNGEKL